MNKPLILVVDDDKAIRSLITTTLETQEYRYHAVSNAGNFRSGIAEAGRIAA